MKLSRRDFIATQTLLEGATLQQVGNMFGVTRERARQMTNKVLRHTAKVNGIELPGTRALRPVAEEWQEHVEKVRKQTPEAWI